MKIKDLQSGIVTDWSIEKMLNEINRDRSDNWTDYDKTDYIEGWDEWVEGEFYTRNID